MVLIVSSVRIGRWLCMGQWLESMIRTVLLVIPVVILL